MKRILLIIIVDCILLITNCLSQWVLQQTGNNLVKYDVQFVNVNTGWITGTNSIIMKSINAGANWFQQNAPIPSGIELNAIYMLNANTGYIVGWTSTFLKTTNGGSNWVQLSVPQGQYNDVYFINEQTGWLCAFLGVIRKTTNGGLNWDSINTGGGH